MRSRTNGARNNLSVGRRLLADILLFEEGLLSVSVDNKWGAIDETGEMVISPQFTHIEDISPNGLLYVEKRGKVGFVDQIGNFVIETIYDDNDSAKSC